MTLKRRWLWTIIGFVAFGVLLELGVGTGLQFLGAGYASQGWLRNETRNSIPAFNASLFQQLRHDALLLTRRHALVDADQAGGIDALCAALDEAITVPGEGEGDGWVVLSHGAARSSVGACEADPGVPKRLGAIREDGITWCGAVPVMVVRVPLEGAVELFTAKALGQSYAERLKGLAATEIELWGPHGRVVSTWRDEAGALIHTEPTANQSATLAAAGESFDTMTMAFDGPYAGYPALEGQNLPFVGRGAQRLLLYVLSDVLDKERGPPDLRVVAAIPAELMRTGARISASAMAAVGLLVVVLLALLARRTAAAFSRPLTAIEQAAKEVAHGQLDLQVPGSDADPQLNSLAASINAMTARLAQSLRASAQQEKMAALGTLAGGIAHEINNPLGVILGFAQGLERRVGPADSLRMPVTSIVREALRCRSLVQEMLAFSRTGAKGTEPVDFEAAVRSSLLLLAARAKMQGVQVVPELNAPLPRVQGSRTQLQQVLVNLGTNALDAMKEGGTLTVRARRSGPDVVLEVADTGTGIPPDIRARIFEPFFTTKPVGEGTGLGLSLVYQIVQQHHGRIDVESEPGRGTLMRVALPAAQPEAKA
jgi:signal transduction histidine kinase